MTFFIVWHFFSEMLVVVQISSITDNFAGVKKIIWRNHCGMSCLILIFPVLFTKSNYLHTYKYISETVCQVWFHFLFIFFQRKIKFVDFLACKDKVNIIQTAILKEQYALWNRKNLFHTRRMQRKYSRSIEAIYAKMY